MEWGNPPTGKNFWRKFFLFPKALLLVKRFPKLVKNSIFYWNLMKNFENFINFEAVCISRPKPRIIIAKINVWFVTFLKNMLNYCILAIFLRIFWKFSKILGAGGPQKSFPLDPNPGYVHVPSLCEPKLRFTSSRFRFLQSYSLLFVSVLFRCVFDFAIVKCENVSIPVFKEYCLSW